MPWRWMVPSSISFFREFSTEALPIEGTNSMISLFVNLPIFSLTALRTSSRAGSFSSNKSTLLSKSRYAERMISSKHFMNGVGSLVLSCQPLPHRFRSYFPLAFCCASLHRFLKSLAHSNMVFRSVSTSSILGSGMGVSMECEWS